jgi:dynactin 1
MDATNCFLFFQRLGMKVDLVNTIVASAHGLPDSLSGPVSEPLVGVCEVKRFIIHQRDVY